MDLFKVVMLIKKRPELTREEFKAYYNGTHVPLVHKLLPKGAAVHQRNFVLAGDADYDVISEVFYEDAATAQAAFAALADPELRQVIESDEDRFMLRGSMKRYVVESHETVFRPVA